MKKKNLTKLYAGICLLLSIAIIVAVIGLIHGATSIFAATGNSNGHSPDSGTNYSIEYTSDDLIRELPENAQKYELPEDLLDREGLTTLYLATLHCSDGVDRTAFSLVESPTYLSADEDKQTTDGIISAADNVSLMSVVYASQGASLGEMLDKAVQLQVDTADEDSPALISDTEEVGDNIFLTGCVTIKDGVTTESAILLYVADENTVQVYVLNRTYEELEEEDSSTVEGLLKSYAASQESESVFYKCLKSLIQAILQAGGDK